MESKSNELKIFATTASKAALTMIDQADVETRRYIELALAKGFRVAISFSVDVKGRSEIQLDVVQGESRVRVATLEGTPHSLQ